MPGVGFRVKFYGHMGRDDDAFSKKLSAALAVEESAAKLLLKSVPTVVKEGLEATQANSLCQRLTSIGALCLVEPIENHAGPHPTAEDQVSWAPGGDASDERRPVTRPFSMPWVALFACALGLGLVLAALSIWSSYTRMTETFGPAPPVSEPAKDEHIPELRRPQTAMALPQLYAETDAVERNVERLRFVADLREREMNAVAGGYRVDRNVVRERRILWEAARAEIDAEMKRLRELKAAIAKIESERAP
jgi:hypothetical protein